MEEDAGADRVRELASRYLSLWQQQLHVVAGDDAVNGLFQKWISDPKSGDASDGPSDGIPEDLAQTAGSASGDGDGRDDRRGGSGSTGC